jgi:hypothetical protein
VSSDDVAAEKAVAAQKIGKQVCVTEPLRVCHVLKAPDLDIHDTEGVIKQYAWVAYLWKGKCITTNLPFKVEFQLASRARQSLFGSSSTSRRASSSSDFIDVFSLLLCIRFCNHN